jgi:serine protease Do
LFNMNSEVIGIDSALYAPGTETGSVGLGFALPINVVKFVVDQVLRAGQVHIGYIGMQLQPMAQELAAGAGLSPARGAIVAALNANSPAQGIVQVGDIILEAGGGQFTNTRAAARIVAMTSIGHSLPILLWRSGAQQTVSVTVAELPDIAEPGSPAGWRSRSPAGNRPSACQMPTNATRRENRSAASA